MKRNGKTGILRQGETAVAEAGVWHDWWNAGERDARVRVEITPGERFLHMIETFFGLTRLGHTDSKGMPRLLQLVPIAREFSDVVEFRSPPAAGAIMKSQRSRKARRRRDLPLFGLSKVA